MTEQPSTDPLPSLSDHLARHVVAIGAGVVVVHGRHGPPFSGFVWRRGAIVTAEEALEADKDITITVPDGRRIGATLAGRDPTTDVAVLRVTDSEDLAPLAASTRSDLGAGHLALAVGRRPEGVIAHVGAVSVVGAPWRSMRGGHIARFLRLDLRLDHRAEGGALVDLRDGRAFGMAVYGPRGSVLGIPMETIERVAERLLAHGRIGRGYLGLGLRPVHLDEETVRRLGLAKPYGLMVVSVEVDGPAHKAGVLQGDVLTAWDGQPVRRLRDVLERIGPDSVGQTATLSIGRAGQPASAQVTIVERHVA
jgi:S1-C subfamily serine protease